MTQLTKQAQYIIDDFKRRVETLPIDERTTAIKEMTERLSALNEEAKAILNRLQKNNQPQNSNDMDVSDYK